MAVAESTAAAECSAEDLQRTLRKLLREVRFSLMDAQTFSTHVVPTALLTPTETTAVLVYITTNGQISMEAMAFSVAKRNQALPPLPPL